MRSKNYIAGAALAVPAILALANVARAADDPLASGQSAPPASSYPNVPTKRPMPASAPSMYPNVPTKGPVLASGQGLPTPYRSAGPPAMASLPLPPASSQGPASLPAIGQVSTPYRSEGPPSLTALGTPQASSDQATGGPYLGGGGSMAAASPYESTAAPGTQSPFANSPSGANAAQNAPPSQAFGAGNAGGGGTALSSGLGGFGSGAASAFAMIGDASPSIGRAFAAAGPQNPPPQGARSLIAPSVRGFKIAENQSPAPQDRFFFSFNYYNNVNKTLDNAFQVQIKGIEIYRYVFGFEKTFNQGLGSVGIRLPIDNVFALSRNPSLNNGGNATGTGNLTVYLKHVFAVDRETGSLATGGVAISPQTAPIQFAGAKFLAASNTTTIQPFFAFLLNRDRFYLQGFSALDVPVDPAQATFFYNDLGVGYYVYRDNESNALITAIAPTFEVHVSSPINHSGAYNALDKFGTPDIVNLTTGLNTRFGMNSILTMGVVAPVTGPRPFSVEAAVLLNVYFGRSARNPAAPIVGG